MCITVIWNTTTCLEMVKSNPTVRSGFPLAAKRIRFLRGMPNYNSVISTAIGTSLTHCVVSPLSMKPSTIVVLDSKEEEEVKVKLEQQSAPKQMFS